MEKLRRMVSQIAYTLPSQPLSSLSTLQLSLLPFLFFASSLYNAALLVRGHLYRFGLLRQHRLPVPVISVGNLTWGGNGKTPMVEYIASCLANHGISPLILTRGYGSGDEARMLQRHMPFAKIGVGADRAATASYFLQRYGFLQPHFTDACSEKPGSFQFGGSHLSPGKIGVAILDDGMQHLSLWRDLEIVMVNGLSPWGNYKLLPLGPLREPLTALYRADAVVVHHADLASEQSLRSIKSTIHEVNESIPIYLSKMAAAHFFKAGMASRRLPLTTVSGSTVLCISAIGSADSFVHRVEMMKPLRVDRLDYSDHYQFQVEDMYSIRMRLEDLQNKFSSNPIVVITEKDYDRDPEILKHMYPFEVLVLCSELHIIPHQGCLEDGFKKLLMQSWS